MKLNRVYTVLMFVILLGVIHPLCAQKRVSKRPVDNAWTVGAKGSAVITFGDIKYWDYMPNFKYGELGYGGHIYLGKYLSPKFALKADFNYSKLNGTKRTNALYRSFETKSQSASLLFQINISQVFNNRPRLNKLSAWGDVGVGWIRWKSILYNRKTLDTLDQIHWDDGYYRSALMIPLGLNIRYYLNKKWSLDAQASTVLVNSDWLDSKKGGIEYDYFVNAGIGINYHFLIQNSIRNVPSEPKRDKGDLYLLDYLSIDPFTDPEIKRISKKEMIEKEEANTQEEILTGNPFRIELWVPELANNRKFRILISIKKRGITGNGYFRLTLPSGFYPVSPDIEEVTYTRIGYNYDFDFYLPMNLDTLLIPLDINVSEREDGTYPIFIDGEVMNSGGQLYPIKSAQYVQLKTGITYNNIPSEETRKELKAEEADEGYVAPANVTNVLVESEGDKTYRIQILACRKPSQKVNEFLKKHHIEQKVFLYEKGGWWRYSIYNLSSLEDAKRHLLLIRNKHLIKGAFIVEFNNGERIVPEHQPSRSITTYENIQDKSESSGMVLEDNTSKTVRNVEQYNPSDLGSNAIPTKAKATPKPQPQQNNETIAEQLPQFEEIANYDNISVYRVEIAVSPANPIPLRQLQNWVANEKITEWMYQDDYRYTIGRFENEQVARAFLRYVRLQFALPDAHLVETKGQNWLRVVR
jgi:hypothetical protein